MWRDEAYLLDMLINSRKALVFTNGVNFERFCRDEMIQAATLHVLQIIGEAASKVSSEFRESHPEIPWEPIVNLRHRLVHDYPRIELPKIWRILETQLKPLVTALQPLVPPDSDTNTPT